jgi:hypothetical protein
MKDLILQLRNFRKAFALIALTICLTAAAAAQTGVKGKIRANSGAGIGNASVTVTQAGKDVKSVRSAADGSFRLEGIRPGVYGLRVEAEGFATGSMLGVEVKKDKVRDLGERLFLKVDEGTQVIIRGSVFFKEGTSVTRAKVELERVGPDGSKRRVGKTETSVSGEFVFRQPEGPAKYRVIASYDGVSGSKEIAVENAAVYRLAISLDLSSKDK